MVALATTVTAGNGWGHMSGWGWGMMVLGWLFMTLVVVLVVWLIWSTARPSRRNAIELLYERYARGELARDEYLERRKDLGA